MEGNKLTEDLTEDQQKDIEHRVTAFNKEFQELSNKYEVDVIAHPQWVPTQNGLFLTQIAQVVVDRKYRPIMSPVQKDNIIKG